MEISLSIMAACLLLVFIQGWIVWYLTYFKKKGEYEAMKEVVDQLTSEINTHLEALMIATENSASYYAATKKIDLIHHSEFSRQFENLERCRVKLNAILFQLL